MSEIIVKKVETPEELEMLYRLRYKVYCEDLGWLDARNYPEKIESDVFDKYSLHFGAFSGGKAIGVVRLIMENPLGLPIRALIRGKESMCSSQGKSAEISRLIVDKVDNLVKHDLITIALIKQVYFSGKYEMKVTDWFAAFDVYVYRLIKMIGFKFKPLDEPRMFMGSKTIPAHLTTEEADNHFSVHNREFYDYLNSKHKIFFQRLA